MAGVPQVFEQLGLNLLQILWSVLIVHVGRQHVQLIRRSEIFVIFVDGYFCGCGKL